MASASGHVLDLAPEQQAYDVCAKCAKPIQADYLTGQLVTIVGRNAECYAPTAHQFTHNPAGATVTHADSFGDGTPLCGWIADDETATADPAAITCRDCIAAKN